LNLIKIPIDENYWKLKEGIIYNMVRKENIDEMFLWSMILRSRRKKKAKLKPYLYGKIFEFTIEKKEELKQVLKKRDVIRRILDLRISCDIQLEKKKKFRSNSNLKM
jgi:hypothetical protein